MNKIRIENWNQYGEYTMFSDMVSKHKLGIILVVNRIDLEAWGSPVGLDKFKSFLKSKNVKFSEL